MRCLPRPDQQPTKYTVQDICSENKDEIISDTYKLIDAGDGLWEVDCKMINKGAENFGQYKVVRIHCLAHSDA